MKRLIVGTGAGAIFLIVSVLLMSLLADVVQERWELRGEKPEPASVEAVADNVAVLWLKHRFLMMQILLAVSLAVSLASYALAGGIKSKGQP